MLYGACLPGLNIFGQAFQILDKAFAPGAILSSSEIGPAAQPFNLRLDFVKLFQGPNPTTTRQSYWCGALTFAYARMNSVENRG